MTGKANVFLIQRHARISCQRVLSLEAFCRLSSILQIELQSSPTSENSFQKKALQSYRENASVIPNFRQERSMMTRVNHDPTVHSSAANDRIGQAEKERISQQCLKATVWCDR